MNCVQSGDPGRFFRKACSLVAVVRNGIKRSCRNHTQFWNVHANRCGRGRHRVADVVKVILNSVAEASMSLNDVALAVGGTLDIMYM